MLLCYNTVDHHKELIYIVTPAKTVIKPTFTSNIDAHMVENLSQVIDIPQLSPICLYKTLHN